MSDTNYKVIQAWLDGKDIEYYDLSTEEWITMGEACVVNPMTYTFFQWRVKADCQTIKIPCLHEVKDVKAYWDAESKEIIVEYREV